MFEARRSRLEGDCARSVVLVRKRKKSRPSGPGLHLVAGAVLCLTT
jgi:hypothetical protein